MEPGSRWLARLLAHIGAPFPLLSAWIVTLTEVLGGIALLIGRSSLS